jgi:hypothetical protein
LLNTDRLDFSAKGTTESGNSTGNRFRGLAVLLGPQASGWEAWTRQQQTQRANKSKEVIAFSST